MKLRLTQDGFENYTGQFGIHHFEAGLTVDHVSNMDATRIAAVMGAEWEDGSPANVGQIYLDSMNVGAKDVADGLVEASAPVEAPVAKAAPVAHSEAALSAIADAEGIAGLRGIGDSYGVKSTSIRGLIDAILAAQSLPVSKA